MNKYLIKLANHLDKKGFHKEADYVDWILKSSKIRERSIQCPKSLIMETRTFLLHVLNHNHWNQKGHYDRTGERFALYQLNNEGRIDYDREEFSFKNLNDLNNFLKQAKDEDLSKKDSFIEKSKIPQACKEREDYRKNFEVKFGFQYSVTSYPNLESLFPYDKIKNEVSINPNFIDEYKKAFNIKGEV